MPIHPATPPSADRPPDGGAQCPAMFRQEPMPYTVYCQEDGHHERHTYGWGGEYYTWLDGDEGAGTDG